MSLNPIVTKTAAIGLGLLVYAGARCGSGQPSGHADFFDQWARFKQNDKSELPNYLPLLWYSTDIANRERLTIRASDPTHPILRVEFDGPGNIGGRTRSILTDWANNNRVFAAAITGGLWRSEDRARTWIPVDDQAPSLVASCITQSPFDSNVLYYGTGEARGTPKRGLPGVGVLKSTDGGRSFVLLNSTAIDGDFDTCWCIEHSLSDSQTIFVGTENGGLQRTTDGGSTWQKALDVTTVTDIVTFPDGSVLAASDGEGLFLSPTGEVGTFSRIDDADFPNTFRRIEIANCASKPTHVYAAFECAQPANNISVVAYSSDGGRTWEKRVAPGTGQVQHRYCMVLGVHPENEMKLVCGSVSLMYSENGGLDWNRVYQAHPDHHAFLNFDDDRSKFLMGTDGGIYEYDWNSLAESAVNRNQGYHTIQCYFGDAPSTGDYRIIGTQDNGSWRVGMPSDVELRLRGAHDGGFCFFSTSNRRLAYGSAVGFSISKTSRFDRPNPRWTRVRFPQRMANEGFQFLNAFEVNRADHNLLFCRTDSGVWRSRSQGLVWRPLTDQVCGDIFAICSTPSGSPTLYLGGENSLFYRVDGAHIARPGDEIDLSASVPGELSGDYLYCIRDVPSESGTLVVGYSDYELRSRVWRIENADSFPLWTSISGDLPIGLPVNSIEVDPSDGDRIFVGTDNGLYFTVDGGLNWVKEARLPNVIILSLKLRAGDRSLFAFTHGRGAWKLKLR